MIRRLYKIFWLAVILILLVSTFTFAKTKNSLADELRFQISLGPIISTGNLLGLIESVKMYNAIKDNTFYDYPGLTDAQKQSFKNLNGAMQRAVLVANILGSMEYGIHARFMWHMLMSEVDVVLLPFDGSYNGRLDFSVQPMIGIRAPFFIMPYLIIGPLFTFSFYPEEMTKIENWKGNWASTDNFAFRPGLITRVGLDIKFKTFAIGGYYQYTIKDFQEFSLWYQDLITGGFTPSDAAGKIFGAQSRFGVVLSFNLF